MPDTGHMPWPGLAGTEAVRYFSLARYALLDALRLLGVSRGARVLLPSFICRDLLAPITIVGAEPCWYSVRSDMSPELPPTSWPDAEVVIAVNFFGFPQDLAPFQAYAERTGAVLIEDNAHGFLSRDSDGAWLGLRAKIGLFSMRKTFPFPDGGALVVTEPAMIGQMQAQLPFVGEGINAAQTVKKRLRDIPVVGRFLLRGAVMAARAIRKWKTGSVVPASDTESERVIRDQPNPWSGLAVAVSRVDSEAEIARRRQLYNLCAAEGARVGVLPVSPALPDNCAPYGYPFRSDAAGRHAMQSLADRLGLDLVTWPDLPNAIEPASPVHYRDVLLINFLW